MCVAQSESSEVFGSDVSFLLQDTESLHICLSFRDTEAFFRSRSGSNRICM